MPGIPQHLQLRLQQTLLACAPLDSHQELKAVFVDARLRLWQDQLLEADNKDTRAALLTDFLFNRYSSNNQNALVTFLRAIGDGMQAEDGCRQPLLDLADDLENSLDDTIDQNSPYRGMAYFREEDAHLFFGREQLTQELVDRLLPHQPGHAPANFLAVVGASGSGKSSLALAGLVPAIRRQQPHWRIHVVTPTAHPLKELANSLTRDSESVTAAATLMDDLHTDPRSLDLYAGRLCPDNQHLLLVVDQFEELFTLCKDPAVRKAFVDNLMAAVAAQGPVTLLLTLRADFYHHCAQYDLLREMLAEHQAYIGPMNADELRAAIERPADQQGLALEPGLVDLLLADVGEEPGALPLLSHALLETWRRREMNVMTIAGYMATGRVQGAIAQTAEQVYQSLTPAQQTIARNIFLRLTELGEGTEDTRRRVEQAELIPRADGAEAVEMVLKLLADARLIATAENAAEVAHEALIRAWPTLQTWLDEDREGLRLHRHLTESAAEWQRLERDPGELYRGARLTQALEWAQGQYEKLNQQEQEFLATSQTEAERRAEEREAIRQRELEQAQALARARKKQTRNARTGLIFTTIGLVIAVVAAFLAIQRQQQRRLALAQSLAALAPQVIEQTNDTELATLLSIEALNINQRDAGSLQWLVDGTLRPQLGESLYFNTILRGHEDSVNAVAFSPDGSTLASGSRDGTIRLWDLAAPAAPPTLLRGHEDWVRSVAFSPDGSTLASGSAGVTGDGTIRLWDLAAPAAPPTLLRGHEDGVNSVAFSPDSSTLASGSIDATIRLWPLLDELARIGCRQVRRNLSWAEWQLYLPGEETYRQTCPNLPVPPSVPAAALN